MGVVGMKLLEVKSLDISIDLNGNTTSIIGPKSSGKTKLLKKLINHIPNEDIFIDNVCIRDYDISFLKNNIFVVFDDDTFKCEYVAEELFYYLNALGYMIDEITKKINSFIKTFKLSGYENKRIDSLSVEMRVYIKILSMLIVEPKIFGIDNLFPYLTKEHIDLILKYIKKKKISLINVINDGEYLKYTEDVIVLNEEKCVIKTNVKDLLTGNSILPYIGIKLPFAVELSNNLMLYGLIERIEYDNESLEVKLWK